MPKKPIPPRIKRPEVPRKKYVRKPLTSWKKESWIRNAKAGLEQYEKLKSPDVAKTYIQNATSLSVKARNMTLLLTALFDVAYANNNQKAMRLISLSDGTFVSVNQILLEMGFFLNFDMK